MKFLNLIKECIPDYAKDIRLNIDGTIARSSLVGNDAVGVTLATAFAAKNKVIIDIIKASGALAPEEMTAALTASALMGMNNIWYPFVEMADDAVMKTQTAQLRMNPYATNGGVDKRRFEMYALAASFVGKCHFFVKSHFELLKKERMSTVQLRDVCRIAAVINAAAQVIAAE